MTPLERAEKIYKIVTVDVEYDHAVLVQIAAEIEEAVKELKEENQRLHRALDKAQFCFETRIIKEAKSEAFEEAAKIAEDNGWECQEENCKHPMLGHWIAVEIRCRAAEGEGNK